MSTPLTVPDPPPGYPERDVELPPELLAWARAVVTLHRPAPPNDVGLSCDERGCLICNVGGEDAAELLAAGVVRGFYPEPGDDEYDEALEEAAAEGVDVGRPLL